MTYEKKITVGVVKLNNGTGTWGATLQKAMPIQMDTKVSGYRLIFGEIVDGKVEARLNHEEVKVVKAIEDIEYQIDHVSSTDVQLEIEHDHIKFSTEFFVDPFQVVLFFKHETFHDGSRPMSTFAHGVTIGDSKNYLRIEGMAGVPKDNNFFNCLCTVYIRKRDGLGFAVASANPETLNSIRSSLQEQLEDIKQSRMRDDELGPPKGEAKAIIKAALKKAEANCF